MHGGFGHSGSSERLGFGVHGFEVGVLAPDCAYGSYVVHVVFERYVRWDAVIAERDVAAFFDHGRVVSIPWR